MPRIRSAGPASTSVNSVTLGAREQIAAESMFNHAPAAGTE